MNGWGMVESAIVDRIASHRFLGKLAGDWLLTISLVELILMSRPIFGLLGLVW